MTCSESVTWFAVQIEAVGIRNGDGPYVDDSANDRFLPEHWCQCHVA